MLGPDRKSTLTIRWMDPAELHLIAEIDRSEQIRVGYTLDGDRLRKMDVDWNVSNWLAQGDHEHTMAHQIAFCQSHVDAGAKVLGAFEGDRIVGVALLRPDLRHGTAQLAYLQVSNGYRRRGIASKLYVELEAEARRLGASEMYVSATPSGSAVGFYVSRGFEPTAAPLPELWEAEPEDIHMVKALNREALTS